MRPWVRLAESTITAGKDAVRVGGSVYAVLVAEALLSGSLGPYESFVSRLAAVALLTVAIILCLPRLHLTFAHGWPRTVYPAIGFLVIAVSYFLILHLDVPVLWVAAVPLLFTGLAVTMAPRTPHRMEVSALAIGAFAYSLVFLLLQAIPTLPLGLAKVAGAVASVNGMAAGTQLSVGMSLSGGWLVVLCLTFLLARYATIPPPRAKLLRWVAGGVGVLVVGWLLFVVLLALRTPSFEQTGQVLLYLAALLFLVPAAVYVTLSHRHVPAAYPSPTRIVARQRFSWVGAVLACLLLSASVFALTVSTETALPQTPRVVVYAKHMAGTWDVPTYASFGREASGMFGLLPVYLTAAGFSVTMLVDDADVLQGNTTTAQELPPSFDLGTIATVQEVATLTDAHLSNASVFVVVNPNVPFSENETAAIWKFVGRGGSLLVLGDHTNVSGIQSPLNALLAPVGIQYRFDAALPMDQRLEWSTCARHELRPLANVGYDLSRLHLGIGASLAVPVTSFPVITAPYAFSDAGDVSNTNLSFLGNYGYDAGEQLGDLVLVAAAYHGDGRVLVFGDTSPFQNPTLPSSYPFVTSVFRWCAGESTLAAQGISLGSGLLLLCLAFAAFAFSLPRRLPSAVYPLAVCVGLLLSYGVSIVAVPVAPMTSDMVLIDVSHHERFSTGLQAQDALNGFMLNLQRHQLLPVLGEISALRNASPALVVLSSPTEPLSGEETTLLEQYMTHGGVVLVATSHGEQSAATTLLADLGCSLEGVPLGPVPYVGTSEEDQMQPRFVDGWPLRFEQGRSLYNFTWEGTAYHLVAFIPYGAGGLLLIGDGQFLFDRNIESLYGYWPGNILFLASLLDEVLPEAVPP